MATKSVWKLPQVSAQARAAAGEGIAKAAEHLRTQAVKNTPVDEGTLRRSAATDVDSHALKAVVSYNTPYAVRQHEELGYHHPKGGKAKYLEDALHDEQETLKRIIATHIRRSLGG